MWECTCTGSRSHGEILYQLPEGLRSLLEIPVAKGQEETQGNPQQAQLDASRLGVCLMALLSLHQIRLQHPQRNQRKNHGAGETKRFLQSCSKPLQASTPQTELRLG